MSDERWKDRAACKGRVDIIWHPPLRPPRHRASYVLWRENLRLALAVCGECPVRSECLNWALNNLETEGIWGGLLPSERITAMKCPACNRQAMKITSSGATCRSCASRHEE
jgi:WhiB family redox-sensing transcriptional regulator